MSIIDEIHNLSLIENGLLHVQFELDREMPSYFRIAREAHLVLYRAMIEALKGSANLAVLGKPSKNRSMKYQIGATVWQEIHRVEVEGCEKAWRFSKPEPCEPPGTVRHEDSERPQSHHYLIGFHDALEMIQTKCFMHRDVRSTAISISDEDIKTLEWLEGIRNVYEHFVPKGHMAPKSDLLDAAELCLKVANQLLFQSNTVLFHSKSQEQLNQMLQMVLEGVILAKREQA